MKPRILILSSSYPLFPGDLNGAFVHQLAKRLRRDYEVFVLAPQKKGFKREEFMDDVHVFRHPQFFFDINLAYDEGMNEKLKANNWLYFTLPFYFLFQLLSIINLVKKYRINVIHANWIIPNGLIAVLYKKYFNRRVRVLSTIHGSDFWGLNNSLGNALKKFVIRGSDKLTVVSNAIKLAAEKYDTKDKFRVIPMGVDTKKFSPANKLAGFKSSLGIKGPLLLFVGIIVESKGVKLLVNAMPEIISRFPHCKLLLAGNGNLKAEMEKLVIALKLENNVKFMGAIPNDELPRFYANADLFILPSYSEGFPVVITEAMSSGNLCLVSDIPVFKNMDCCGELIYTFGLSKPETLPVQAINLLENVSNERSDKIRHYALENFDWDMIAKRYSEELNFLIGD